MPNCLLCQTPGELKTLNNLAMRVCPTCSLMWRETFELPGERYENYDFTLNKSKVASRLANCEDRVKTFRKYINLDNTCDVGCGEGIFLMALKNNAYKNFIGIEPSALNSEFIKKHDLPVVRGSLEDLPAAIDKYKSTVITMFHLIEHLDNPKESLELVYSSLPAGGYLILETPDTDAYELKKVNYRHPLVYPDHLYLFNVKNLTNLLIKTEFAVTASGRRDFNQQNMGIKQSLQRLGLITMADFAKSDSAPAEITNNLKDQLPGRDLNNIPRRIIRQSLARLVIASKRLNYIWIIAQKK